MKNINIGIWKMCFLFGVLFIIAIKSDVNKRVFSSKNETVQFLREGFVEIVDSLLQTTCSGKNSSCPKHNRHTRALNLKYRAGLDLIFVLDASNSITKRNFKIAKRFMKTIVKIFGISTRPKGTRIACVAYGRAMAQVEFLFNDHVVNTKERALKRIDRIVYRGGGTATRVAFDTVRNVVLPSGRSRVGSTTALFVITNGKSIIGGRSRRVLKTLQAKGVEIYAVGIGRNVNVQSLRNIASGFGHCIMIRNNKVLKKVKKWIVIPPRTGYSRCGHAYYKGQVLDRRARMVGGEISKENRWPWAARIFVKNKHYCGGTLINQQFVLTAASCVNGKRPQQVKVVLGAGIVHSSIAIHIHPKYDGAKFINDIALIKIPKLKRYSRSWQAICLPRGLNTTNVIKPGNSLFTIGWGTTKPVDLGHRWRHDKLSVDLKQVKLPFIADVKCADHVSNKTAQGLRNWYFNSDTQFCAADTTGKNDTCRGDSGGPAMVLVMEHKTNKPRWYQVGIVSWGYGCAQAGEYGYYTKVSAFQDWVDKKIKI